MLPFQLRFDSSNPLDSHLQVLCLVNMIATNDDSCLSYLVIDPMKLYSHSYTDGSIVLFSLRIGPSVSLYFA